MSGSAFGHALMEMGVLLEKIVAESEKNNGIIETVVGQFQKQTTNTIKTNTNWKTQLW